MYLRPPDSSIIPPYAMILHYRVTVREAMELVRRFRRLTGSRGTQHMAVVVTTMAEWDALSELVKPEPRFLIDDPFPEEAN